MAGDIDIVIGAQDKASKVIDDVASKVGGISATFASASSALGPLGVTLGVVTAGFAAAAGAAYVFGSAIADSASRIDVSAAEIEQAMGEVAKISAVVASGGSGSGASLFKKLGVDAAQLSMQEPIDQFLQMKDAINQVESATQRAAIARELFGEAAAAFGGGLTDSQVAGVKNMNAALTEASGHFTVMVDQVTAALAPAVEMVAISITDMLGPVAEMSSTWFPAMVDSLVASAGHVKDIATQFYALATFDTDLLLDSASFETGIKLTQQLAEARRKASQRAIDDAKAEKEASDQRARNIEAEALAAAEAKAKEAVDSTVKSLERKLAIAKEGSDAIEAQEQLALATNDAERERIALLQQQIAEQEKLNEAVVEQAKAAEEAEKERLKLAEEAAKESESKATLLANAGGGVQASESRLMTRGPMDKGIDKVAKNTEKTNAKMDELITAVQESKGGELELELVR